MYNRSSQSLTTHESMIISIPWVKTSCLPNALITASPASYDIQLYFPRTETRFKTTCSPKAAYTGERKIESRRLISRELWR